jgi:hypothetical protein
MASVVFIVVELIFQVTALFSFVSDTTSYREEFTQHIDFDSQSYSNGVKTEQ